MMFKVFFLLAFIGLQIQASARRPQFRQPLPIKYMKPVESRLHVSKPTAHSSFFSRARGAVSNLRCRKKTVLRVLFWISCLNAGAAVITNSYDRSLWSLWRGATQDTPGGLGRVYSTLFYFAKMSPQLLFTLGALLRALQLCTPLRHILDPSAGVGFGVSVCALIARCRWIGPLTLGWAGTRWVWEFLGAAPAEGAHVPIRFTMAPSPRSQARFWSTTPQKKPIK